MLRLCNPFPDAIALAGESHQAPVRILPPNSPLYLEAAFHLAVNVDSLTEMPRAVAENYRDILRNITSTFWSVNHEFNPFTVRELYRDQPGVTAIRYPYPLRRGYVEELFRW